jgi:hypothetical protein
LHSVPYARESNSAGRKCSLLDPDRLSKPWQIRIQHRTRLHARQCHRLRKMLVSVTVTTHSLVVRGGAVCRSTAFKPAGRGFDSRFTSSFRPHCGPGADSDSEYQRLYPGGKKYSRCVRRTTLPPLCAKCLFRETLTPTVLTACPGL